MKSNESLRCPDCQSTCSAGVASCPVCGCPHQYLEPLESPGIPPQTPIKSPELGEPEEPTRKLKSPKPQAPTPRPAPEKKPAWARLGITIPVLVAAAVAILFMGSRLLSPGTATIGIRVVTVTGAASPSKVYVSAVDPEVEGIDGGPRVGDEILRVNGAAVEGFEAKEIQTMFEGRRAGRVELELDTSGEPLTVSIERTSALDELPDMPALRVTRAANVRDEPSLDSNIIQTAVESQCLLAMSAAGEGRWVLVVSPNTYRTQGFISRSLVEPVPSCDGLIEVSESDLAQLDRDMSELYLTLRRLLPSDEAEALLQAQRAWLDQREEACGTPLSIEVFQAAPEARACLWDMIRERKIELEMMLSR